MTAAPDVSAIRKRLEAATPGPWAWVLGSHGTVRLSAMHSGMLTVMDFVRQGMQAAVCRFSDWDGRADGEPRGRRGGVMRAVEKLLSGPHQLLKHPDAELIAHAPTDLAACVARIADLEKQLAEARAEALEEAAKVADARAEELGAMIAEAFRRGRELLIEVYTARRLEAEYQAAAIRARAGGEG